MSLPAPGDGQARLTPDELRHHLVATRLAGEVQTSPANTLRNCRKLVCGDEPYTFGLSDWRDASLGEVIEAVRAWCGEDLPAADTLDHLPSDDHRLERPGRIQPHATVAAIRVHRERLAAFAGGRGTVLLATGHPTGLLPHYQAIGRALQAAGATLLTPAEGEVLAHGRDGRRRELRYLDGVACLSDGASLRHTHRSRYMEAALDALGGGAGEAVIGDDEVDGLTVDLVEDRLHVVAPVCVTQRGTVEGAGDAVDEPDCSPPSFFGVAQDGVVEGREEPAAGRLQGASDGGVVPQQARGVPRTQQDRGAGSSRLGQMPPVHGYRLHGGGRIDPPAAVRVVRATGVAAAQ
jgi:hypothetical protein